MTFAELSKEYRSHADGLERRISQLNAQLKQTENADMREWLFGRIQTLSNMEREARQLSVTTAKIREAV